MTKIAKKFNIGLWVIVSCFVIIVFISLLFTVWLTFPYNDLTIKTSGELQGVEERDAEGLPIVNRGTSIFLEVEYCNQGVDVYSKRYLESSNFSIFASRDDSPIAATQLPSQNFFIEESHCGVFDTEIPIPEYVVPGLYRLKNINTYEANPLVSPEIVYYSEMFKVV